MADKSTKKTGFLDLPFELREIIYDLTLVTPANAIIKLGFSAPKTRYNASGCRYNNTIENFKLLRALCRQLYIETKDHFFAKNNFTIRRPQGERSCPRGMHNYILSNVTKFQLRINPRALSNNVMVSYDLYKDESTGKWKWQEKDSRDNGPWWCTDWFLYYELHRRHFAQVPWLTFHQKEAYTALTVDDLVRIRTELEEEAEFVKENFDWDGTDVISRSGMGIRCCGCDGYCCRCGGDSCLRWCETGW